MKNLTRPDVILTHESDLDGFVSGLLLQRLAKRLFDADVRLEAFHYNNWQLREPREKAGWICDLSFEPRLDKPDWVIIDHHATDAQPKNARLIHDLDKSAGLLCYELCKENGLGSPELDRLVHLNNVADLFLEDDPDFALANDYANLVKTYQFWNLHALIEGQLERLLDHPLLEVMAVKRRIEDPMGLEWSKEHVLEIIPTVGFVDTVIGNTNLIVHQLLENARHEISGADDAVSQGQQHGGGQFAQPQRRGAESRRKIAGRRPRQRLRRHPAPLGPKYSGRD